MAPMLEHPAEEEQPPQGRASKFDAAAYLKRTLPRQPGDTLKVFPLRGRDAFRVNWYSSRPSHTATLPGLNIAYIRESKFLYCRLNAAGTPEITYPARQ